MQEYHPYKITPGQGWDKMKPILDKAMPEDSHKRRYPFVWWSMSSVVVVAVMGFILFDGGPNTVEQPVSGEIHSNTPVVKEIPATSINHNVAPGLSIEKEENKIFSGTTSPVELKTSVSPSSTVKKRTNTSFSTSPVQVIKPDANEKTVPLAITEETEFTEPVFPAIQNTEDGNSWVTEQSLDEEELTTAIVTIYIENYRDGRVIEPLPTVSTASLQDHVTSDQILIGDAMKNKWRTSFMEPNIAVSGLAAVNGGLGVFGEAGVNLNVAKRFSVTTSIGYFSYNPNSFLSDDLKSLDSNAEYNTIVNYDPTFSGNESYVYADNVNSRAGYNAINPLVDKLTQWQVSTGLKWKVSPRFFTEGGVQFGFCTHAYSEYPIVSVDQIGSSAPAHKFNNSLDDYEVIRSSTTSLYLGIGYLFGQHFDVFSNWTHGLDAYILNDTNQATAESVSDERTDYIRGLSLGLRYTL